LCELTEAAGEGQSPKISRKELKIRFLGTTEKTHNWRGFPGITLFAMPRLQTRVAVPAPRLYSNYESAWTWDIFLLSMLNEMVSASY